MVRPYRWFSVALIGLAACTTQSAPEPDGPSLRVSVSALELATVADACYSLAVTNEAGQPVWSRTGICGSAYGSGADITYIAPCDATDVDGGGAMNTITLKIEGLFDSQGASIADFVDPCSAPHNPGGCKRSVRCDANADALVEFNLTLMRQANQGFFDIAVNFSDIFCSAKVDCADTEGLPLRLVHHPVTRQRTDTVVVALACTTGNAPGSALTATHLYRDDLKIICGAHTSVVDPSEGPGNVWPGGVGAVAPVVQAMVFEGVETLPGLDKLFWNVAIGLEPGWFASAPTGSCRLVTRMGASEGPLAGGAIDPLGFHPYIDVDVTLWTTGPTAQRVCSAHPLNATGSGVSTAYTEPSELPTVVFAHEGRRVDDTFDSRRIVPPPRPPAPVCEGADGWTATRSLLPEDRDFVNVNYPRLVTNGSGKWLAVWAGEGEIASEEPYPEYETEVFLTYSHDDRLSWQTRPITLPGADDAVLNNPWLAHVAGDAFLAVFRSTSAEAGSDGDIFFSHTEDGGVTWTLPALLNASGRGDSGWDGEPTVAVGPNGTAVAAWHSSGSQGIDIRMARSTDGGKTWSLDRFLNDPAASTNPSFSPSVATDGEGLWLVAWQGRDPVDGAGDDFDVLYVRSDDDGLTWSPTRILDPKATVDTGNDGGVALFEAGGTFIASWWTNDTLGGSLGTDFDVVYSRSTDGGLTWSYPVPIDPGATSDSESDFYLRFAGDGSGRWVAAWQAGRDIANDGASADNAFAFSEDDGLSWSTPAVLSLPDKGFGYVSIATDGQGDWGVVGGDGSSIYGTFACGERFGGP